MKAGYEMSGGRDALYSYMHSQAEELGIAATLAWAVYAWPVAEGPDSYNFAWGSPGTAALEARFGGVEAANERSAAAAEARGLAANSARRPAPSVPVPPFFNLPPGPPSPLCTDVQPPSGGDCAAQRSYGKCSAGWMVAGGFCRATCGACGGGAAAVPAPSPAHHETPAGGQKAGRVAVPGLRQHACAAASPTCAAAAGLPAVAARPAGAQSPHPSREQSGRCFCPGTERSAGCSG